ncbi:MAG: peptide deformylase [Deltaproteobacteria bacterium]|nr:peptide deformylase [Deltaproteobacteria bacterium]
MAIRPILHYPDKRLRTPGKPIEDFGPEFQKLVDDMAETMYAAPGVGLAAPQLGESLRLFIIDIATEEEAASDLRVFANPEIFELEGEVLYEEGCLSFPGIREDVVRAERVRVRAQDRHGERFELQADELLAIALQHENDHLDGKLMIDHLSLLKRRLVHRNLTRRAAEGAVAE